MSEVKKNEVAVAEKNETALQVQEFIGMMGEEMDGLKPSFDRIKIPSGGQLAFEVYDENGEPDIAKELIGIIVDHYPLNAYWRTKFDGANNPPDCYSMNGKIGEGTPGGKCASCPLNQFGSGEGGVGKACKNMHRVYLLQEGSVFPVLLTLPPTSTPAFGDYIFKRLLVKGKRPSGVQTKITLKKETNKGGIQYSACQFSVGSVLDSAKENAMVEYSQSIKALTRAVPVQDEYVTKDDVTCDEYGEVTSMPNNMPF